MPYGDRTGPEGRGSMTGRRAGYCVGNDRPGSYEPSGYGIGRGGGRGLGRGGGRGLGRGVGGGRFYNRFPDRFIGRSGIDYGYEQEQFTAPDDVSILQSQSTWLKEQLDYITGRLDAILKAKTKED